MGRGSSECEALGAEYCSYFSSLFLSQGNIWVFRVLTPNTTDPTAVTYCRHSIYWFTFGTIVAVYGLVALGIVLCCCCCCVAAFKVGKTPEMYNH